MVQVYLELVKRGKKTIDQVPANIREEVRVLLEAEQI